MNSAERLIKALSAKIDDALGPLVPRGAACALVDFPSYTNAGDSAIWMGEWQWLRRNGNEVVYSCDIETYSRELLAEKIGRGIILLHGGGNFGDVWPAHQQFHEQVVRDFPGNKIIQLPQSIHFNQEKQLERTGELLRAHPDFTLMCRDRKSFDLARRELKVPCVFCPDMAFALGPLQRPAKPKYAAVWLARTDKETRNEALPQNIPGLKRTDWLEEAPTVLRERNERLRRDLKLHPENRPALFGELSRTWTPLARQRLRRGCRLLGQGRVVVTDRLHGHILCLLLGIPHVLLDNSYGKVRGFYDAWTAGNDLTVWAGSTAEAVEVLDDPQRRPAWNLTDEDEEALGKMARRLKRSMTSWATPEERDRLLWQDRVRQAGRDMAGFLARGQTILLVDEDQIRAELGSESTLLPFPERHRLYGGPPPDDDAAIGELERLRGQGAGLLVVAWPAFWWLDHYKKWAAYLHEECRYLFGNERMVVFDLIDRQARQDR